MARHCWPYDRGTYGSRKQARAGNRRPRSRAIYLLPNLFTTGCLFSGFYAIVAAIDGNFERAGFAVFVAMLFDTLDGRVARMTSTESAFGKEYDSLADMVSFGVAPAIVAYQWGVARLVRVRHGCGADRLAGCVFLRRVRGAAAGAFQYTLGTGQAISSKACRVLLRRPSFRRSSGRPASGANRVCVGLIIATAGHCVARAH